MRAIIFDGRRFLAILEGREGDHPFAHGNFTLYGAFFVRCIHTSTSIWKCVIQGITDTPYTRAELKFMYVERMQEVVLGIWNESLLLRPVSEYCLLYTSPSPRDQRGSRMPSSA